MSSQRMVHENINAFPFSPNLLKKHRLHLNAESSRKGKKERENEIV